MRRYDMQTQKFSFINSRFKYIIFPYVNFAIYDDTV